MIAHPDIVQLQQKMTAVTSLANPGLGQALVLPLIQDGSLPALCAEVVTPYYRQKRDVAVAALEELLAGVEYVLHEPKGAFFLWLWLPGVNTQVLAQRLKEQGVLVISGHWFFFGQDAQEDVPAHQRECLRLTYSMPEDEVRIGIQVLAEELQRGEVGEPT